MNMPQANVNNGPAILLCTKPMGVLEKENGRLKNHHRPQHFSPLHLVEGVFNAV